MNLIDTGPLSFDPFTLSFNLINTTWRDKTVMERGGRNSQEEDKWKLERIFTSLLGVISAPQTLPDRLIQTWRNPTRLWLVHCTASALISSVNPLEMLEYAVNPALSSAIQLQEETRNSTKTEDVGYPAHLDRLHRLLFFLRNFNPDVKLTTFLGTRWCQGSK